MKNRFEFHNEVHIRGFDLAGQPREQRVVNSLTYAAADIMIAAMLQSGPSKVTYLYAQHGGSSNTAPVALPADRRTATRDTFVQTIGGYDNGGLWIPILAAPAVSSTDVTIYEGNQATYFFRIPGTLPSTQFTGNFVPGTSLIYSLGLAVSQNLNNRTTDTIISVLGSFTPFPISINGQEAVDYPLQVSINATS